LNTEKFCFDPLPEGFMLPKPVNSVKDEVILKLEAQGRLAITRKRNGYRIWAVKDRAVKLFTRGANAVTACFPHITAKLEMMMPPQSFLDGEMHIIKKNGEDDFPAVGLIFKNSHNPQEAIRLQEEKGYAHFMIFDVVFWEGEKYIVRPWQERYDRIQLACMELEIAILLQKARQGLRPTRHPIPTPRYLFPVEILGTPFKQAEAYGNEYDWEGLVLYDTEGSSDFRLDHKVARPQVAWKRKPIYEDDFIVRRWIPRKNNPSMVKEFVLSQIDPETGKEVDCGKCGSGLTNAERLEFAHDSLYPLVVEVRFYDRFASGKLQFASIVRIRDDKKPEECLYQKEDNE
jgi:ATP-dependent DNA ligase